MDRDELSAWLQLLDTPGVGRQTARRLLAALGSPMAVVAADEATLAAVVGPALARQLRQPIEGLAARVERTLAWRAAEAGRSILTLGDADYPAIWLQLPDPPLLLYAHGDLTLLQRPAVAIVGSRRPTPDGLGHARKFAAELAAAGLTVISGMAEGVDGAAHQGALDSPGDKPGGGGRTIAVVGTGLDRVYPRQHHALARRIATEGLLLSEYALGTAPLPAHFPQRNRLIAAHALGTLVVEAALKSGSLITARLASEAGREVFAIPGSIHNPQARGCHALIRQGAKLVESTQDVLEELRLGGPTTATPSARTDGRQATDAATPESLRDRSADSEADGDSADAVLEALGWSAATLEVLQLRTGWSASDLSVRLLELELAGQVARLPGQLFQRCAQA